MNRNDDDIEHVYLEDEEDRRPRVHSSNIVPAVDSQEERRKLMRMLMIILAVSLLLTLIRGIEARRLLADFIAVFFIAFAAIKFADLEAFAHTYRKYDILAGRVRPWGYIVPFIQALLGFYYLLSDGPVRLNIFAIIFTGMAMVGAIRAFKHKHKTQYAYHKTLLRLPFTRVSVVETSVTFFVVAVLLVLSLS